MKKTLIRGIAISAAMVALSSCSAIDDQVNSILVPRDENGQIKETTTVRSEALLVGDCFNDIDDEVLVDNLEATPCSEPHESQVYAIIAIEKTDDFPSDAIDAAAESCAGPLFTDFIGVEYNDSVLNAASLSPSGVGWVNERNPTVMCYLTIEEGGERFTEDLKDAGI